MWRRCSTENNRRLECNYVSLDAEQPHAIGRLKERLRLVRNVVEAFVQAKINYEVGTAATFTRNR